MNSIWNKNTALFEERFPQLSKKFEYRLSDDMEIETSRNGSPTAKEKGILLHSKYNPEKEAGNFIDAFNPEKKDTAVFLGFGLGYGPVSFAEKFPEKNIILVENDAERFFTALNSIDWSPVFRQKKIVLLLDAALDQIADILGNYPAEKIQIFRTKSQTNHNEEYFNSVEQIILQNKDKEEVNTNTLEKFAGLWLSNSCRNLNNIKTLDGINKYFGLGKGIPFVILAAGPSLQKILPFLEEIKKRAVLICVDTALHACLKNGVEPDFIILADPQYYCSLHLEFLEAPSSILITEIAVYPSVFRFKCREKVLFSSLFPIGEYFENNFDKKGKLAAGGSVSTSAWDFARFCSASEIFIAGMDLGYPGKETHIRGSKFEEKSHYTSTRIKNAETENLYSMFSAGAFYTKDYNGNRILTDRKMNLFSRWFERQCTEALKNGIKTYTLTPESSAINGIEKFNPDDFLKKPLITSEKKKFFLQSEANRHNHTKETELSFEQLKMQFIKNMESLENLAKRGTDLCRKGIQNSLHLPEIYRKLNELDKQISSSAGKESASLVFPTQRQLEILSEKIPNGSETEKKLYPLRYSELIYKELLNSIKHYKKFFYRFL